MQPTSLRRVIGLTWAAAALLLLALATAVMVLLRFEHDESISKSQEQLLQVLAAAEADVNRTLMSVDLALAGLPVLLQPALLPTGIDGEAAHRVLAAQQDRVLVFTDLALVNESGTTITTALAATRRSGPQLPPGLLADVRAQPVPALVVSNPVIGLASGERSLLLARAIELPGSPPVIAIAEVPTAMLLSVASSSMVAAGLSLSIEREDGTVLVMQPTDDRIIGQRLGEALDPAQAHGAVRAITGRVVPVPTLEASRPTLYPHLLLAASVPESVALAHWEQQRNHTVLAAGAFALLLLAAAAAAQWQLTRLAQARLAAAGSAALLDQALASMGDAFLLCDAQDRVLRWNERYLSLFPWLRASLHAGMPFRALAELAAQQRFGTATSEPAQAWIEGRLRARQKGQEEIVQSLHSGEVVSIVERRMPEGGMVSVYRDMSSREAELAAAKAAAESANEAKTQFLANMSHEIRTPLNAVLGLNDLLLGSPLQPDQRRHAELVRNSGQLLLSLINDILDLSRIEAGHFELQPVDFEPRGLAQEVLDLLQERAQAQDLVLGVGFTDRLAPRLRADAVRVRQVLFNLVGNALKFTDQGHVQVTLDQLPAPQGVMLQVSVADTGIGITPQAMATLFDRFTQADATSARRHGGSGLGLAITREVVVRMGGTIRADSEPGRGSCFIATLHCEVAPAVPAADAAATAARRSLNRAGLRVLVAEDNPVNQVLIEAMLLRMNLHPRLVANGREALEQAAQGGWDLVLMDMQMPELDGLAATRGIRALPGAAARVPIVALTANARDEDRRACLDAGMDDYVSKPLDLPALEAAIDRVMQASRAPGPTLLA